MAITKVIEIDVDELKALGGLDNLNKAVQQTDKSTASLKTQIREATIELVNAQKEFGDYSEAALNAAKKVATLKDQIQEAKETSQLFDPGAKFQAATGAIAAGANAVQGYQAALGLLGVEGEAAQETLLKVQSAMALSQSLSGIADSAKDFQRLGAVAKQALSGIRSGIAATGIGLLVVALGAIVAYWDDIKAAVNGVSSEQEALNVQAQTNLDIQQSKLDTIGGQENILKLQGKSEKDILKLKIAQTDEVIKATENQIAQNDITAKAQIAASERNRDILAGIIKFIQTPLTLLLEGVDMVGKALGQNFGLAQGFSDLVDKGASLLFDPEAEKAEAEKVRKESEKALQKLKNDRAGMQLSIKNIDAQASKDAAANRQKEIDDLQKQKDALKAIEENNIKEIADLKAKTEVEKVALQKQRELAELDAIKLSAEEKAKALLSINEKYKILETEAKAKDAETKKKEDEEKLAKDQEAKLKEFQLNKEFEALSFEEQRAILTERETALLNDKLLSEEQRTKLAEEFAKSREEIDKREAQAKKQNLEVVSSALSMASDILGETTGAGKALAVASTTVSTYLAAQQAYTSQLIPGDPSSPVRASIAAGVAVAGGLMNVKKILSVKTPGGKGGGATAPSGGGGATAAPSFNVVGNAGVNQIQQTLGGGQPPIQAYVVANNVTTQQSLDRNIVNNASL
jgi:hypothetical protein